MADSKRPHEHTLRSSGGRLVSVINQVKKNDYIQLGEVSEWPKEHAWKVCIRKRIEGSNPSLTATNSIKELE